MESTASSSNPQPGHGDDDQHFTPTQPMEERVIRALRHRLRLLHRSEDSNFFVLGATGNVYTVNLATTPSCTCPDETNPCKHILFVLIRVLGLSLDDNCLWSRTLRPCQLDRLFHLPTAAETLASDSVRVMFHRLFFQSGTNLSTVEVEEGSNCPICLEEMRKGEQIVACETCKNQIHEKCLTAWKNSSRRRKSISCVICRARWTSERLDDDEYLNLSAYVSEEDMTESEGRCYDYYDY